MYIWIECKLNNRVVLFEQVVYSPGEKVCNLASVGAKNFISQYENNENFAIRVFVTEEVSNKLTDKLWTAFHCYTFPIWHRYHVVVFEDDDAWFVYSDIVL